MSSKFIGLFFVLFFSFITLSAQDSLRMYADSLSLGYWQNAQWNDLVEYSKHNEVKSLNSISLFKRFADAYAALGYWPEAEAWALKVWAQKPYDEEALRHMFRALQLKGEPELLSKLGKKLDYSYPIWQWNSVNAEVLYKPEPLNNRVEPLLYYGLGINASQKGHSTWQMQWGSAKQTYFWESFNQNNLCVQYKMAIDHKWLLRVPVQLAWYQSTLLAEDTIEGIGVQINNGTSEQLAWSAGTFAKRLMGRWTFEGGFQAIGWQTNTTYRRNWLVPGFEIDDTVTTENRGEQWEIVLKTKYMVPIWGNRIVLGINTGFLAFNGSTFLNVRPFVQAQIRPKLSVYADYWHKNGYLLADGNTAVLNSNTNTQSERYFLGITYRFKERWIVSPGLLYEEGKDALYFNRNFEYFGFYTQLQFQFKP